MTIKLYLISQSVETGYDTYDSAVVAAENEEQARQIDPGGGVRGSVFRDWEKEKTWYSWDWAHSADQVQVEYLGDAKPGTKVGVICASFNAG